LNVSKKKIECQTEKGINQSFIMAEYDNNNQTIISDITDTENSKTTNDVELNNNDIEMNEIVKNLENKLNKLTHDSLKDKCK
jgi:hypothetical protein